MIVLSARTTLLGSERVRLAARQVIDASCDPIWLCLDGFARNLVVRTAANLGQCALGPSVLPEVLRQLSAPRTRITVGELRDAGRPGKGRDRHFECERARDV